MERFFNTSAPQIADTEEIYSIWNETHPGGLRTFTEFMTSPSPERDAFLDTIRDRITLSDQVHGITTLDIR